ncbi:type IV secretory system conjugative DNA transfer family protein [Clostridium perfringens]|nr:type IV secretory system conjugative DNA transfer family protein [Clostridium perfringens]EGT0014384.1 type IV secretory system conjugative DNA transfer family protein [Clostridium perfringens]
MEQKEEKKEKKRLNFNFKLFKQKVNIIFNELKPLLKNPKVWIAVFIIWYIESPIMVMINKGFFNVSLISLYLNPFKLAFEFITCLGVIWTFIKFNLSIFFIFIIICLVMHLLGIETEKLIDIKKILLLKDYIGEKEGEFEYAKSGEYGTAKWATLKSIEKANRDNLNSHADPYVAITSKGDDGLLFGYWMNPNGTNSRKIITLPKKTSLNRNVAVFGSSGSMKSRSFVIPNILNLIKNNESLFVTDPKGELLAKTYDVLIANGYTVKAFNINNIPCSDRWNVLQEIKDEQTASIFAKSIIENTKDRGEKGDSFWDNHYVNFLKAIALYVRYTEKEENQNMAKVYEYITYEEGLEGLKALFDKIDNTHPAKQAWITFNTATGNEKVAAGVISGLSIKLDTLQIPSFRDLLSGNDIDLTAPGREKCAYFVVVPDTHATFNFLAGLFFTFAFINLIDFADKLGDALPYHVNFLLDEFPNIAKIPDFEKKISTVRSRGVSICVIFQTLLQLESRYSKEVASEILGNCDSKVFLGANEIDTATYISKMLDDTTIKVKTKIKGAYSFFDDKVSTGVAKRELKKPGEVLKKPRTQSYVLLSGLDPIKALKMDYTKHSMGNEVKEHYIYDMLKPWSSKYHEKYLEEMCKQLRKAINKVDSVKNSDSEVKSILNNIVLENETIISDEKEKITESIKNIQNQSLNNSSENKFRIRKRTEEDSTKEQIALNMKELISIQDDDINKKLEKLENTLMILEDKLKEIRKKKEIYQEEKSSKILELKTELNNINQINELMTLDEEVTNLINDTTTTEDQLFNLRELKSSIAAKREELIKINKDKLNNKFKQQIGNIKIILENSNITTEELEKARYKLNECRLFAEENNLQEIQLEKINELDALRDKLSEELYQKNLKENSLINEEDSWANEYIDNEYIDIDDAYVEINNIIDNNENQGPLVNDCLTIEEIEKNELKDLEEESININKVKEKTLENEPKNNQKQKNDENVKKINGNNTKKCENNTKVLYNKNEKINKTFKNNSKNNFKSSKKSSSTIELDI